MPGRALLTLTPAGAARLGATAEQYRELVQKTIGNPLVGTGMFNQLANRIVPFERAPELPIPLPTPNSPGAGTPAQWLPYVPLQFQTKTKSSNPFNRPAQPPPALPPMPQRPGVPPALPPPPGGPTMNNTPISNPLFPSTGGASIPAFPSTSAGTGGIGSLCGLLPSGWARTACEVGANFIPGLTNQQTPGAVPCPPGYEADGKGGCKIKGLGTYLPADVGMPDTGWTPVAGRYGVGTTPIPVQRVTRACPPGFVLGKDGVCYDSLPRTARAHNPGTKPMLTGGDVNALRRARSLEKKIGKLARVHGKKSCHCHGATKKRGK